MSLYNGAGLKLVMDRHTMSPLFSLRVFADDVCVRLTDVPAPYNTVGWMEDGSSIVLPGDVELCLV